MAKQPEPRREWEVTVYDRCDHCEDLKQGVKKRSQYVYGLSKRVEQTSCEPCFVKACTVPPAPPKDQVDHYPWDGLY